MAGSNVVITVVTVVVLVAVVAWIALSSAGNDADGNPHTTIFIEGTVSFDDGREDVGVAAHLNKNGGHDGATPTWRIAMSDSAGTQLSDFNIGDGFTFDFDADGALTECMPLGEDAGAADALLALDDAIESGSDVAVALGVTVTGSIADGYTATANGKTFTTSAITLGSDGSEVVATPSADACKALYDIPAAEAGPQNGDCTTVACEDPGEPSDFVGRRLDLNGDTLWGGTESAITLWWVSQGAYSGSSTEGWTDWQTCESDNAYAKFMYKYPTMTIAFAGTDGVSDIGDWLDNLDTDIVDNNGIKNHEGFHRYMSKVEPCINNYRSMLAGWGIGIDYIVGHSLGGAAATVYSQHNDNPATNGVFTFGAPATRNADSCSVPGERYAHEKDAISSNALGLFDDFDHDVVSSTQVRDLTRYCSNSCWFGCCRDGWSWTKQPTRSMGCTTKSGGCRRVLECAYYFGTVHLGYDKYM